MHFTHSPVPVQSAWVHVSGGPSALTICFGVVAALGIIGFTVQLLRMPAGSDSSQDFRTTAFVSARTGLIFFAMMVVGVGMSMLSQKYDEHVHDARMVAKDVREAAIQAEIKAGLSDYYGVTFPEGSEHTFHMLTMLDSLPVSPVDLQIGSDPTVRKDCFWGSEDGFYILACGRQNAPIPLEAAASR